MKISLLQPIRVKSSVFKVLGFFLLAFSSMISFAQVTVTIGTGTSASTAGTNGDPIYRSSTTSSFHHSKSIHLLTASQLSAAGIPAGAIINSWAYNKLTTGTPSGANGWTFRLYLKNSTATALASGTAWSTMISGAVLAYSATITSANMPATAGYWTWPTSGFTYTGGAIEAYVEWFPATTMTSPFTTATFTWQYTTTSSIQGMGTSNSTTIAGTQASWTTQLRSYNTRIQYTPGAPCSGLPTGGTISPSAAQTKCAGQSQAISVSGATNASGIAYQWQVSTTGGGIDYANVSAGTGATTTNYNTGALSPGIYYYRMKTTCTNTGDTAVSGELTINVNALPSVTVSSSASSVCVPGGSAATLTAGGASTYAWSPTTGLTPTSGSPVAALPTSSTTYTVTGTDGNGCTNTSTVTLGVSGAVVINGTSATPPTVCPGGSSSLNVTVAGPSAYCIPVTGCTFPDIITNVTFAGINRTSTCDGSASSGYTYYNSAPNVASVNAGSTYTLSVSTGGDIEGAAAWIDYNQNGTFDASENLFSSLAGTNPATYTVSVTIPAGAITGTTRMRVRCIYNSNPSTLAIPACSNTTYGETEDYDVQIAGGASAYTYNWAEGGLGGTLLSTSGNPVGVANVPSTTTYTVTVTNAGGCSATATTQVLVNPLSCQAPTVVNPACSGAPVTITANITGGGSPFTYVWNDGNAGVYPNSSSISPNLASGNYSYTVTVYDACGASCSSDVAFTVYDTPTGSLSGPATALVGQNVTYTVTGYTGTPTFVWEGATSATGPWNPIVNNSDSYTINTVSPSTLYYRCTIIGAGGCSLLTGPVSTSFYWPGDNVCDAILLSMGVSAPFSNIGATTQTGEPAPPANGCSVQNGWCNSTLSNTMWFKFVAPPSGKVQIGNMGSLWDNQMALYSVGDCNNFSTFTLIAANDDSSGSPYNAHINAVCLVPGQTYYLQVDAYSAGGGLAQEYLNIINETAGVSLSARAMLSGCYDPGTGMMHDSLRTMGLIPLNEPYSAAPYSKPAIGEANGETTNAGALAVTGNNAIVDWCLIELRSASNPATILANKRALIQRDGDIVAEDGTSPVNFSTLSYGMYYVTVKHRNHLGIMTASPVALGPCNFGVVDLTSLPLWVKAGELNGPAKMMGSLQTMWAADANRNKNTKYNGLSNDKQEVLNAVGVATPNNVLSPVYRSEDANMDGKVKYNNTDNDRNVIANMVGTSTPNNIVNQHTPN